MNNRLMILNNGDQLTYEDAIVVSKDIEDGFNTLVSDARIPTKDWERFLTEIKKGLGEFKIYDYSLADNSTFFKYMNDKARLYIRGDSKTTTISLAAIDDEVGQIFWNTYTKFKEKDDGVTIFMINFTTKGSEWQSSTSIMTHEDLNFISDKYYPYINTSIMFEQFFTGSENILLVVGAPGLGKSKLSSLMLKFAIENSEILPYDKMEDNPGLDNQFINCAYVKSTDVLAMDSFWSSLEADTYDFVILDDLDYMLTKRDSEVTSNDDAKKNNFLNQFLSFTDGIKKNNTKFIITTNQTFEDIDSALLRKGRMFDILELRRLDKAEALEIWKENELEESEFNSIFTQHEILSADLGSEINKRLNKRIENTLSPYLKEEGISKMTKAGRAKKIGL